MTRFGPPMNSLSNVSLKASNPAQRCYLRSLRGCAGRQQAVVRRKAATRLSAAMSSRSPLRLTAAFGLEAPASDEALALCMAGMV
jgi:hypothetical protein